MTVTTILYYTTLAIKYIINVLTFFVNVYYYMLNNQTLNKIKYLIL